MFQGCTHFLFQNEDSFGVVIHNPFIGDKQMEERKRIAAFVIAHVYETLL